MRNHTCVPRSALTLTTLLLCLAAATAAEAADTSDKPNIVMILVDDLGYGDLSCYGARDLRTPQVDKLMAAGIRLDNFYANCPVCSPTRASLLTGRYPDLAGVPGVIRTHRMDSWGYLDPQAVLLPQVLKQGGYHTALVGKWHLGLASPNKPHERGFDIFRGFLGDMMDDYTHHRRHGFNYMFHNDREIDPQGHATDLFSDWSVQAIRDCSQTETPFFLYLAYNAPHTPIQPPAEWLQRVKAREPDLSEKRAKLVAFIEHLDSGIGKVMQAIEASPDRDNTLVIFTSDNGGQVNAGANNGSLRGGKQQMYEGGIRVPFCAVWPSRIEPGTRSQRVALTMDLYPTICAAAGLEVKHAINGKNILPTLCGQFQAPEERTLFWVRREGNRYGGQAYYAVRYGDYKLLQNTPFEPMELYHLRNDPAEQTPLQSDHPMYKKLFTALRNHINESGAVPWQSLSVGQEKYTH